MKETWVGTYRDCPFRVIVNPVTGRIVEERGAPVWAKGLRIRQFKREVWKGDGNVEREIESKVDDLLTDPRGPEGIAPDEDAVVSVLPDVATTKTDRPKRQTSLRIRITAGMNLKEALRAARRLGCVVHTVRRSGEIRVFHTSAKGRVNANNRKKGAPRSLTTYLAKLPGAVAR